MTIDKNFLEFIFSKQPGMYIAIGTKKGGRWQDHFFTNVDDTIDFLESCPHGMDLYFCPTKLSEPRRKKPNVCDSTFLYADLDEVDPREIAEHIRPSIAWESSKNRYQCLWQLTHPYRPTLIERHNKGLAYHLGADRGGWDLTQVLRIPGTHNFKYPESPEVRLLWLRNDPHEIGRYPSSIDSPPKPPAHTQGLFEDALARNRSRLSRKTLNLLRAKRVEQGKRSDIMWHLAHELTRSGVSSTDSFTILKNCVWNKYKDRLDEDERIQHELEEAKRHQQSVSEEAETPSKPVLFITEHKDFMGSSIIMPDWLVDGFWMLGSHGIVAGEPKSFKSTLVTDLVVSVASGKPFLNQFPVKQAGQVLVVQNENADWIMQNRLFQISKSKSLAGEIVKSKSGTIISPPTALPISYINSQGFSFDDPYHMEIIEDYIREIRPVLVVFDPLYLMFAGNLNSAEEVHPLLSTLLRLKNTYGCAILVIHHLNKSGNSPRMGNRILGSVVLNGWSESAWYIQADVGMEQSEPKKINEELKDVRVDIDREFRGGGIFPRLQLTLTVGNLGSDKYEVKAALSRGRPKLSREKISDTIKSALSTGSMSMNEIAESIGSSKKVVREVVTTMIGSGELIHDGKKVAKKSG